LRDDEAGLVAVKHGDTQLAFALLLKPLDNNGTASGDSGLQAAGLPAVCEGGEPGFHVLAGGDEGVEVRVGGVGAGVFVVFDLWLGDVEDEVRAIGHGFHGAGEVVLKGCR
jgi:hypothetical protein